MKYSIAQYVKELDKLADTELRDAIKDIMSIPYKVRDEYINSKKSKDIFDTYNKNNFKYYVEVYNEEIIDFVNDFAMFCNSNEKFCMFLKKFIKNGRLFEVIFKSLFDYEYFFSEDYTYRLFVIKKIFLFMQGIYNTLGENIYDDAIKRYIDILYDNCNIIALYVLSSFPSICFLDKPYFNLCLELNKSESKHDAYYIISDIHYFYNNKIDKSIGQILYENIQNFISSYITEKYFYDERYNIPAIGELCMGFLIYLLLNIYNSIFCNINVDDIFRIVYKYNLNIYSIFSPDGFEFLKDDVLSQFVNSILHINKINSDYLEEISNIESNIGDNICVVVLYEIVLDRLRKGEEVFEKRINIRNLYEKILAKYNKIPSFVLNFLFCFDFYTFINNVKKLKDKLVNFPCNIRTYNIYLSNENLLKDLLSSNGFYNLYWRNISFLKQKIGDKLYRMRYWIYFEEFMNYMGLIIDKKREYSFPYYITNICSWNKSSEDIFNHFLSFICFVIIPILFSEHRDIKYIDKVLDKLYKILFDINIGIDFERFESDYKSIYIILQECTEYSYYFIRSIYSILLMCIIYYFGINIFNKTDLYKIDQLIDMLDSIGCVYIFDVIDSVYRNDKSFKDSLSLINNIIELI